MLLRTPDSPDLREAYRQAPEVVVRPGVVERTFLYAGQPVTALRWFCQDCKAPSPEAFMVKHWLWKGLHLDGIICLDCFEKRLGRPLVAQDFLDPKYNGHLFRPVPALMPDAEWERVLETSQSHE